VADRGVGKARKGAAEVRAGGIRDTRAGERERGKTVARV
jgi:hypothetical protein